VVTLCITSLTWSHTEVCPQTAFISFAWFSEYTAILLHSINQLIFEIATMFGFPGVGSTFLYIVGQHIITFSVFMSRASSLTRHLAGKRDKTFFKKTIKMLYTRFHLLLLTFIITTSMVLLYYFIAKSKLFFTSNYDCIYRICSTIAKVEFFSVVITISN
jgi:hypothetical protein